MTSWLRPFARKPNLAGSAVPGGTEAGGGAVEGDAAGVAEAAAEGPPEPPSSMEAEGAADAAATAGAGVDGLWDWAAQAPATTAIAVASAKPSSRGVRRRVAIVAVGTATAPTS